MASRPTLHSNPLNGSAKSEPLGSLGIQSDTAFNEANKRLNGRDLCSIADLTVGEMAAIMELGHTVKEHPEDFRHALDAKQLVMFFEKASLRTRLTFEAAINTLGGNALFVDQTQSPLGERESLPDMAHNIERWMNIIVLPHVRARDHHRVRRLLQGPRHQRPLGSRASLPGHRRLPHHRRALRLRARPPLRLRRRRQQRLPLLMLAAAQLGTHCYIATPKAFVPKLEIIHKAIEISEQTGGTITLLTTPSRL